MNARELSLVSRYVLQNGKALVIAANKMDALPGQEERQLYLKTLRECLVGCAPRHTRTGQGETCASLAWFKSKCERMILAVSEDDAWSSG